MKLTEGKVIKKLKGIFGDLNITRFSPGPWLPSGISDTEISFNGECYKLEIKIDDADYTFNQYHYLNRFDKSCLMHIDIEKKLITYYFKTKNPEYEEELFKVNDMLKMKFRICYYLLNHWSQNK